MITQADFEPAAISQFDIGAVSYGICLAAWERGLGRVVNGQGIMQSNVVREHVGIPEDQNIMICIAMGYPDKKFSANEVRSLRADNADFIRYVGFEEFDKKEVVKDYKELGPQTVENPRNLGSEAT